MFFLEKPINGIIDGYWQRESALISFVNEVSLHSSLMASFLLLTAHLILLSFCISNETQQESLLIQKDNNFLRMNNYLPNQIK